MKTKLKKNVVRTFKSFKEAEKADREYYFKMTPEQRLSLVQELREMYSDFICQKNGRRDHACGKRLQRVVKIVKQK